VNQAYTLAAVEMFGLFGVLSMLMIPLIWITRKSLSGGAAVAAD
jgi:DHA2 family multidrug resistance protein